VPTGVVEASVTNVQGRVERWRGGLRLRFHLPLIEPDGRISRIRLSDKGFLVGFVMLSPTEGYRQLGYPLAEPLNGPLTSECFYDDPFVSSLRLLPAGATQLPGGLSSYWNQQPFHGAQNRKVSIQVILSVAKNLRG
jgi:hypothetical protein